ncbi:MAG: hypothetical protein U9Q15_04035 [Patescibacteria group bacterium]|nr:hypothetical protein [Patescibacteria group bacterium]
MYQNISNTAAVDEQVYNSGYTYTTISEFQTQFQSAVSQQVSVEAETLAFVTGSLVLVNESASVSDLKNILENNLAAGEIVVNNQTKEVSDVLGLTDYMDGSLADIESNEYYDALMPAYQDLVMQNIHYYKQENGDYMNASAILGALNWAVSYYRDQEDQDALDSVNSVVAGNGTGMIAALTSYSGTLSIDTEMITGEYSSLTYAEKILVGEQMTTYNYTDKSIVKQVFMYTIDQVQNGSLSFDFSVSVDHFFADMFGVFDSFFSLKTQD